MSRSKELKTGSGTISLHVTCGEVIGQQKWSETHVSASGGGGYVGPQGGHVSAPTISSKSVTRQQFWVREDDGNEASFNISEDAFPVHEGQKVWIAFGSNAHNHGDGRHLYAYNQNADRMGLLLDNWAKWLYGNGLLKKPFIYRLLTSWLPFLAGLFIAFVLSPVVLVSMGEISVDAELYQAATSSEIPHITTIIQIITAAYSNIDGKNIVVLCIIGLIIWLPALIVLRIVGRVFFLNMWEKRKIDAIQKKVFTACALLVNDCVPMRGVSKNA
jgi:hypothetical protein